MRRRKASCLGNQPGTSQTCRPQPCPEDPHHCSQCRQRSIPCCESVRHIPELWTRDLGERLKMNTILSKRCYLMLVTIAQSDVLCQVSSELNISLTSQDHVATSSLNVEFCGCSNSHYRQRCTAAGRRWYWLRQTMPWRQRWSSWLHTYAMLWRVPSRWEGEKDEKWEYPSVSVHYRFNTDLVMQCVSLMYPCMIREWNYFGWNESSMLDDATGKRQTVVASWAPIFCAPSQHTSCNSLTSRANPPSHPHVEH